MKSNRPKVLHTVGGQPMLVRVLRAGAETTEQLGLPLGRLAVVVGHGADQVRACLARDPGLEAIRGSIETCLQDPPRGTGDAVAQALPLLDDDALRQGMSLVLYGDVPLTRPETLAGLVQAAQAAGGMAVLTALPDDPTGYGRILRNDTGGVVGCVEQKDASAEQLQIHEVNTGILAVPTEALHRWIPQLRNDNAQGEYYLTDVLAMAASEGMPVAGQVCTDADETLGVNDQLQRAFLERRLQRLQAEALMRAGVHLADPARIDIRGELSCGSDVLIDAGCVFEGAVQLGDDVTIGPNCVLKNVSIAAGTRIEAFSHLEQAVVGERCVVGPYARLRPGTRLAEAAHVGNFVELKACELGAYSKANHLSYLGDATIGSRVNIGAGTITCNYDGANKHRTIIEDDVFVGSDTQLVAPVVVHQGATLGAGTTLTADAPADLLTLSRARQTTVPRWKRPKKQAH